MAKTRPPLARLGKWPLIVVLGVAGFHTAYTYGYTALPIAFFSILLFSFSLIRLAKVVPSDRGTFCYDLSYSRVADDLARQGVRALLVPTMDVLD